MLGGQQDDEGREFGAQVGLGGQGRRPLAQAGDVAFGDGVDGGVEQFVGRRRITIRGDRPVGPLSIGG